MTPQEWNNFPIWILPELSQSKWARYLDWHCSGLISRRSYTELKEKPEQLKNIIQETEFPLQNYDNNQFDHILIYSNLYFDNEALLINSFPSSFDPEFLFDNWVLPTTLHLRKLDRKKALFFLKDGASSELTWNLQALCQKKLHEFDLQFIIRTLNHVL